MSLTGTIISATRHHVHVRDSENTLHYGKVTSKSRDIVVGDNVVFTHTKDQIIVEQVLERKNCLLRSLDKKTKKLAANLDHLFIVTAPLPLFNTQFIDRLLAACLSENIPRSLVFNKIDLENEAKETEPLLQIYKDLSLPIHTLSTKHARGLEAFEALLQNPTLRTVALCGISGVGKSSLLKKLLPHADAKIGDVSEKSGQGRQTTTQAMGYLYERPNAEPLLLIDLPGLQNFGISHLSVSELQNTFSEFRSLSCKFPDCTHHTEPDCGIKDALNLGLIAPSRYQSFCDMLAEIKAFKHYE